MQELVEAIVKFRCGPEVATPTPQLSTSSPNSQSSPPDNSLNQHLEAADNNVANLPRNDNTANGATPLPLNDSNFGQPLQLVDNNLPRSQASEASGNSTTPFDNELQQHSTAAATMNLSEVQSHLENQSPMDSSHSPGNDKDGGDNDLNVFDSDEEDDISQPNSNASPSIRAADNPDIGFGQSVLEHDIHLSQGQSASEQSQSTSGWGQSASGISAASNSVVNSDSETSSTYHRPLNQNTLSRGNSSSPTPTPHNQQNEATTTSPQKPNTLKALNDTSTSSVASIAAPHQSIQQNLAPAFSPSQPMQGEPSPLATTATSLSQLKQTQSQSSSSSLPVTLPQAPMQLGPSTSSLPTSHTLPLSSMIPHNPDHKDTASSSSGPTSLPLQGGHEPNQQEPWKMTDGPPPRASYPAMRTRSTEIGDSVGTGSGESAEVRLNFSTA